jgi:hypothetical protein
MNDPPSLARNNTIGAMSANYPARAVGVSFDHVPA